MPPFRKEQGEKKENHFFVSFLARASNYCWKIARVKVEVWEKGEREEKKLPTGAFAEKKRNSKFRNSVKRHLLCAPVKNKKL